MSADIAKEADKPTPAQLVAEASVVVRFAATQWRPAYALAQTIATIGDLQSAVTDLAAENARLREWVNEAMEVICDHTASCKDLHHAKNDQHDGLECPVEKRIGDVEARGWELLRALAPATKEGRV